MKKYNSLALTLFCIALIFIAGCREQTSREVEDQPQYGSGLIDPAEKVRSSQCANFCFCPFNNKS